MLKSGVTITQQTGCRDANRLGIVQLRAAFDQS
jgi:hypothetical protein